MGKKIIVVAVLVGAVIPAFASDRETLLIAPGDVLHIEVADTPEMEEHVRVTDGGTVPIIGIGEVKVADLTPGEAAIAVHDRLVSAHYLNHPQVLITVEEFATEKVSIIGDVKAAGVYPIQTARPILDVLALAGGLDPEADRHILIERHGDQLHPIRYYVSNDGEQAITDQVMVNPGDTVVVPRAGIVYILGDVNRPGGYAMSNNQSQLSLLEGLALAGGVSHSAKQGHAHLIRKRPDGTYLDMELSVGDIQKGKRQDMMMMPGDVLYLPFSYGRNIATNGASGIVASAAGASIYAIP